MAHDVFISHSTRDKAAADAACAVLEGRGLRCWIAPRDVVPGASWAAEIAGAISAARVFLLIFSASANASEQVQREVDLAANHHLTIIPLRIENTLPQKSLEYYLNTRHWLDAFTPPLDAHLNRLADAIQILLGETPTAPAPVASAPPPPAPDPEAGRRRIAFIALGVVAAFVFGALGWIFLHGLPRPAPPSAAAGPASALDYGSSESAARTEPTVFPRAADCVTRRQPSGVALTLCVGSVLEPQRDAAGAPNAYGAANLLDGNPATAWCEGAQGPGVGQQIAIHFSRPQIVTALRFVNGYAKSAQSFARNNSVHAMRLLWPDGTSGRIEIADRREASTAPSGHARAVDGLTLRIESVNGGSKWPDTCVSEIALSLEEP